MDYLRMLPNMHQDSDDEPAKVADSIRDALTEAGMPTEQIDGDPTLEVDTDEIISGGAESRDY